MLGRLPARLANFLTAILDGWRALRATKRGTMTKSANPQIVHAEGQPRPENRDAGAVLTALVRALARKAAREIFGTARDQRASDGAQRHG